MAHDIIETWSVVLCVTNKQLSWETRSIVLNGDITSTGLKCTFLLLLLFLWQHIYIKKKLSLILLNADAPLKVLTLVWLFFLSNYCPVTLIYTSKIYLFCGFYCLDQVNTTALFKLFQLRKLWNCSTGWSG